MPTEEHLKALTQELMSGVSRRLPIRGRVWIPEDEAERIVRAVLGAGSEVSTDWQSEATKWNRLFWLVCWALGAAVGWIAGR